MQEHRHHLDVDGTPEEVWSFFWYRGPRPAPRPGDERAITIEILHPGDAEGEGLVRHCTFPVPRYLLSGGVGQSWEWLTQVKRPESWKYEAVGKPLWSRAEGWTRLEDLGGGRTRIHFHETYEAFNPVMQRLLERPVHRFISRSNQAVMSTAVNDGLRRMRQARSSQPSPGAA